MTTLWHNDCASLPSIIMCKITSSQRLRQRKSACLLVSTNTSVLSLALRPSSLRILMNLSFFSYFEARWNVCTTSAKAPPTSPTLREDNAVDKHNAHRKKKCSGEILLLGTKEQDDKDSKPTLPEDEDSCWGTLQRSAESLEGRLRRTWESTLTSCMACWGCW